MPNADGVWTVRFELARAFLRGIELDVLRRRIPQEPLQVYGHPPTRYARSEPRSRVTRPASAAYYLSSRGYRRKADGFLVRGDG
jgi:hypothetical protein